MQECAIESNEKLEAFLPWIDKKIKSDNLQKVLKKISENTDMLRAFYRYHNFLFEKEYIQKECDSILVLPESKIIVNIEVKSGEGWNAVKEASKQTQKRHELFKKAYCSGLNQDWKFVKAVCCPNVDDKKSCESCLQLILQKR